MVSDGAFRGFTPVPTTSWSSHLSALNILTTHRFYVLPAFGILLVVTVAFIYFWVCRPHGGLCCCCRKCFSYCARRCCCLDLDGRIKVLLITDIFGNRELKNLLSMLIDEHMVKKQKIDVVGIVTTGGNNSLSYETYHRMASISRIRKRNFPWRRKP